MFITKKHLSRRMLLKGAGVAVGLPFLEAMVPAATAAPKGGAPLRMGFFYIPHGAVQGDTKFGPEGDRWTPSGSGKNFKLNAITQPLEPVQKYVSSIGNLVNAAGAGGGTVHIISPGTWLSCTRPVGVRVLGQRGVGAAAASDVDADAFTSPRMSATLDQIVASRLKGDTTISSLEVASETTVQQAAGIGSPFTTLSFSDATTPLKAEHNPKIVFNRLFGAGQTPRQIVSDLKQKKSLLDLIQDQSRQLKGQLGKSDKAILDNYLDSVRSAERRIEDKASSEKALEKRLADIMLPGRPKGELDEFDQQVKLMFDMIAIAFQADLTRVVSFIMVAEGSNKTYNHVGVPESFHPISHHANDPDRIKSLVKIQTWHMSAFAQFLTKLAEAPDGDGSLLDHSLFLYGSNLANSDKHSNWPLPTLVVGGGNGKMKKGGRHIAPRERMPLANVHLSLLNKAGIETKQFADSTGTISEL